MHNTTSKVAGNGISAQLANDGGIFVVSPADAGEWLAAEYDARQAELLATQNKLIVMAMCSEPGHTDEAFFAALDESKKADEQLELAREIARDVEAFVMRKAAKAIERKSSIAESVVVCATVKVVHRSVRAQASDITHACWRTSAPPPPAAAPFLSALITPAAVIGVEHRGTP